jgi:hypothetical protein
MELEKSGEKGQVAIGVGFRTVEVQGKYFQSGGFLK